MATYYNGCEGDMILGGTSLLLSKWDFTDTATMTEVMAKGDGGYSWSQGCGRKGEINFEGFFDGDVHEGDPPVLYASKVAAFELEMEDGGASISGTCIITEFKIEHDYSGVAKFSGKAQTRGAFYLPGEATS